MADLDTARHAKETLKAQFGDCAWYRGVGLSPAGAGFCVRLNVEPQAGVKLEDLPKECEGVPVEVVMIGDYRPRPKDG